MKIFDEPFHPCGGFYLQGALRWTSIVNAFVQIASVVLLIANINKYMPILEKSYVDNVTAYILLLVLWVIYVIHIIVTLFLDFLLFKSATKKLASTLKTFIGATVGNLLVVIGAYCVHTTYFQVPLPNPRLGVFVGYVIYKSYIVYVAYRFIKEIQDEAQMASAYRDLTDYEISEFESGQERHAIDIEMKPLVEKILYERYKREDFEIPMDNLDFDKQTILGSGEFGTVYKATLNKPGTTIKIPVAIKTVKTFVSDVRHFKALLMELKIMTFIGQHSNIVNLIGASTAEIKIRQLYIVMELCMFGSLQSYLKTQRGVFVNLSKECEPVSDNSVDNQPESNNGTVREKVVTINDDEDVTSSKHLAQWAKEIADGMDYLSSKKVIHGDLALRNVLMTEDRTVKITDFGLARQLYHYSVYVKKQNTPLPWRWLALEALVDMQFSTHSDIWSYGVTLWELYQLAESPWPKHIFCLDFVNELKRGMRMGRPKYASKEIYEIMMECWQETPESRPSFKKLSGFFGGVKHS